MFYSKRTYHLANIKTGNKVHDDLPLSLSGSLSRVASGSTFATFTMPLRHERTPTEWRQTFLPRQVMIVVEESALAEPLFAGYVTIVKTADEGRVTIETATMEGFFEESCPLPDMDFIKQDIISEISATLVRSKAGAYFGDNYTVDAPASGDIRTVYIYSHDTKQLAEELRRRAKYNIHVRYRGAGKSAYRFLIRIRHPKADRAKTPTGSFERIGGRGNAEDVVIKTRMGAKDYATKLQVRGEGSGPLRPVSRIINNPNTPEGMTESFLVLEVNGLVNTDDCNLHLDLVKDRYFNPSKEISLRANSTDVTTFADVHMLDGTALVDIRGTRSYRGRPEVVGWAVEGDLRRFTPSFAEMFGNDVEYPRTVTPDPFKPSGGGRDLEPYNPSSPLLNSSYVMPDGNVFGSGPDGFGVYDPTGSDMIGSPLMTGGDGKKIGTWGSDGFTAIEPGDYGIGGGGGGVDPGTGGGDGGGWGGDGGVGGGLRLAIVTQGGENPMVRFIAEPPDAAPFSVINPQWVPVNQGDQVILGENADDPNVPMIVNVKRLPDDLQMFGGFGKQKGYPLDVWKPEIALPAVTDGTHCFEDLHNNFGYGRDKEVVIHTSSFQNSYLSSNSNNKIAFEVYIYNTGFRATVKTPDGFIRSTNNCLKIDDAGNVYGIFLRDYDAEYKDRHPVFFLWEKENKSWRQLDMGFSPEYEMDERNQPDVRSYGGSFNTTELFAKPTFVFVQPESRLFPEGATYFTVVVTVFQANNRFVTKKTSKIDIPTPNSSRSVSLSDPEILRVVSKGRHLFFSFGRSAYYSSEIHSLYIDTVTGDIKFLGYQNLLDYTGAVNYSASLTNDQLRLADDGMLYVATSDNSQNVMPKVFLRRFSSDQGESWVWKDRDDPRLRPTRTPQIQRDANHDRFFIVCPIEGDTEYGRSEIGTAAFMFTASDRPKTVAFVIPKGDSAISIYNSSGPSIPLQLSDNSVMYYGSVGWIGERQVRRILSWSVAENQAIVQQRPDTP